MTQNNGNRNDHATLIMEDQISPQMSAPTVQSDLEAEAELATRTKLRARQKIRQNRFVIVAAGAVVFALLIFALVTAPHMSVPRSGSAQNASRNAANGNQEALSQAMASLGDKSLLPITDSGRPVPKESHDGYLNEQDLERSAIKRTPTRTFTQPAQSENTAGTLGAIPPFGEQPWQAPSYQPGMAPNIIEQARDPGKSEREALDKSSLVFVRTASTMQSGSERRENPGAVPQYGLGLPTGTRLRARLESSASTAVRTPVLAVIEYNYERDGEIIVPAGSKAVGQIQEADRSGYMRIQFDSLILPDGATVPIQAAATDLAMGPVKGKVEGKNTGKNVLVRSLSGIGQAGTMLVGRGSLNQPLSESDVIRERVSDNIGQASDAQISRFAVTARIVVSIPAGTPIYVVLEQSSKSVPSFRASAPNAQGANSESVDQLGQLLRLQQELNQTDTRN
ncbi:MAG: TrbI/VirB10 family protein [Terriglobales bacterium]